MLSNSVDWTTPNDMTCHVSEIMSAVMSAESFGHRETEDIANMLSICQSHLLDINKNASK